MLVFVFWVFVTGCHRSGTSLLASLMHGLVTGKDPRQRHGDLALKLENPLGFFESERLVETNDALLKVLGCWDRPPLLPLLRVLGFAPASGNAPTTSQQIIQLRP